MATLSAVDRSSSPEHARRRAIVERATVREVLMGAQDNLTNVLAVVLGVYTSTGAERDLDARRGALADDATRPRLGLAGAAVVTGLAGGSGHGAPQRGRAGQQDEHREPRQHSHVQQDL